MLPFSIISNTNVPDRPIIKGTSTLIPESASWGTPFYGTNSVIVGNTMYMFMGWGASGGVSAGFYSVNLTNYSRITLSTPSVNIGGQWMGIVGDYIYMGGGRVTNTSSGSYNNNIYRYSITNDTWELVAASNITANGLYVGGHVLNGEIYSIRGSTNFLDIYNPSTGVARTVALPFAGSGNSYTSVYRTISGDSTSVYVTGVLNPTTTPVPYLYQYTPSTNTWTSLIGVITVRPSGVCLDVARGWIYYISASTNTIYAIKNGTYINIPYTPLGTRAGTTLFWNNSILSAPAYSQSTHTMIRIT